MMKSVTGQFFLSFAAFYGCEVERFRIEKYLFHHLLPFLFYAIYDCQHLFSSCITLNRKSRTNVCQENTLFFHTKIRIEVEKKSHFFACMTKKTNI